VFQVALENRKRGIPWQIEEAIGSTEYPIVGAGTNEEELSTMMYLFHSATKVFVLGHPKDELLQPSEDRQSCLFCTTVLHGNMIFLLNSA